jgi:hypothetical protein
MSDISRIDHQSPAVALREAGIAAARAGQELRAHLYLSQSSALDPDAGETWLWLAEVASTPRQRRAYLQRAQARQQQELPQQWRHTQPLSATPPLRMPALTQLAAPDYLNQLVRRSEEIFVAATYLLAVGLAEAVTGWGEPRLGLILHGLILLSLFFNAAVGADGLVGRLCLILALIPLNRMVSFSIPLAEFGPLGRYVVVVSLLFMAVVLGTYQHFPQFWQKDLGHENRTFGLRLPLLIALIGLPLGLAVYHILEPPALTYGATSVNGVAALLLITLLVLKELVSTLAGKWQNFGRLLNIAIGPLLAAFFITVAIRIAELLG